MEHAVVGPESEKNRKHQVGRGNFERKIMNGIVNLQLLDAFVQVFADRELQGQ